MAQARYADFNARLLAHSIDLIVMLPFFYLFSWWVDNNLLMVATCWGFYTLYHILFELSHWHGTPGKKVQRIAVISSDERSIPSLTQIIYRNMAKIISILLLFVGVLMIAIDKKRRGLHDRIAGTIVIFC